MRVGAGYCGSIGADELLAELALENLANEQMTPMFAATVEATEEAIYNAILKATTVQSSRGELRAIPLDEVKAVLEKYRVLNWGQSLP